MSEDTVSKPATAPPMEGPTGGAQILREVIGLIVGLAVAFGIVGAFLTEIFFGSSVPQGLDFLDPVALSAWFASMPIIGVIVMTLIFPAATAFGVMAMSFISRWRIWPNMVLGMVMAGAGYAAISMLSGDTDYAGAAMLVCIPLSWIRVQGIWKDWSWSWSWRW